MFKYILGILVLFNLVICIPFMSCDASKASDPQRTNQSNIKTRAYTPSPGSAERKSILDALRRQVHEMSGLSVVFVVTYLKAQDGWAWIEANPQSADEKNHYEHVSGLLQKINGKWRYVNGPPGGAECEEDPGCADISRFFKKIKTLYPSAPASIFPSY